MTSRLLCEDRLWEGTLVRCVAELERLPPQDRDWLKQRLLAISHCQLELDRLFREANGPELCASCRERCCDCGRHHFTLTNLLGFLLRGVTPPRPDYSLSCPFAGKNGCHLDAADRPFNCVSFLCDAIDAKLDQASRRYFYQIEKQLRSEYESVAGRYPAASLRGLLISLERAGDVPLLQSRSCRE